MMLSCMSCNFLDVDPELGVTEEDVFSTYKNYKLYFDYIYFKDSSINMYNIHAAYPMFVDFNERRFAFVTTTDAADAGRSDVRSHAIKNGQLNQETCESFTTDKKYRPFFTAMFKIIRIANRSIENIGRLTNAKPADKADILGSAYFARAYAHFSLCRFMGGMPYIAESQKDDWDLPRLSSHETFTLAAEDFYRAYEYLQEAGKMRRDARPGMAGHGAAVDMDRPSGCAALAMRAMCLMYAASDLSNVNGVEDWKVAAEAYGLALTTAQSWGYALLPKENYTDNFYGKETTNETLWGYAHSVKGNNTSLTAMLAYPQSNKSKACGICPTQNFVDKYETLQGDPLNTAEDRAEAVRLGHYNEQDPYSNRDPRFELTILHDGSVIPEHVKGQVNIHFDTEKMEYPETLISNEKSNFGIEWGSQDGGNGYSCTGYYIRKQWRGGRGDKDNAYVLLDPLVRLGEMYLSYAECVNEAYGPHDEAGWTLTAAEAVDAVRNRIGMPALTSKYTADKDAFRERLRNERNVELAFEGNHYYYDIRRWKTAPQVMTQTLYGMYIETTKESGYPNGKKYERRAIPSNRQCTWRDYMYYWPVPDKEADKLVNFQNIYRWQ